MRTVKTLNHIVAKADITKVVHQKVEVSLNDSLYIGAFMVEVAHRREVVALIIIAAQCYTVACSLCRCGVACILRIVVGNNVSGL